ncbi:hypothetical protein D3C85_1917610 [compost metagenome]
MTLHGPLQLSRVAVGRIDEVRTDEQQDNVRGLELAKNSIVDHVPGNDATVMPRFD